MGEELRSTVQAVLEARQAAAAAESSATFCQHKVHMLEATLKENTAAYTEALRKCRDSAAKIEHHARFVGIAAAVVLGINVATFVVLLLWVAPWM